MRIKEPLKLSQLQDDVEISIEETNDVYTVAEVKEEIRNGEVCQNDNWFVIERRVWRPNAASMIESYIENEHCYMYEDWDERANDCITSDVVEKIQSVLDEAFKGDYATAYWTYKQPIEIDIDIRF
ncbi:hypothetical protein QFZ25_001845 [Bacillus atrophaeus]|uniref:hypothetical protein n=1 Tax=Bacillus atrophaeus TaxID=1452 RepID=UPI00227F4920|nr:hypothetical protein [Bacillus atrophaeus]MCY8922160.1 hypothetical protein [Bacillus atrophaeus]MDQ0927785.1 hypothetical protein [Bacillus atrophaeus]